MSRIEVIGHQTPQPRSDNHQLYNEIAAAFHEDPTVVLRVDVSGCRNAALREALRARGFVVRVHVKREDYPLATIEVVHTDVAGPTGRVVRHGQPVTQVTPEEFKQLWREARPEGADTD